MDTLRIVKKTAREASQAPIFNYASMAHNNHFFFKNLRERRPDPSPIAIPPRLKAELEGSFSSIDTLKGEMILTANAMFGPGFVWLVKLGKSNDYKILTTYLAGSPYSAAHWRRQGVDMNTEAGPASDGDARTSREWLARSQLAAGASNGTQFSKLPPGGIDVIPLLCVSTWEHAWLRDYGVGQGGRGGKRAYLELWWNAIDWAEVYSISHPRGSESHKLK
jgi:superoxide dismutase, Fe-Mn family